MASTSNTENTLDSQTKFVSRPTRRLAAWREYAFSYICSASLILGSVLLLRFAIAQFGEDGFNQLLIVRRFASALLPLVSLGLAVNIAKLVPREVESSQQCRADRLLAASLQLSLLAIAIYLAIVATAGEKISTWLTGEPKLATLLVCLSSWMLGLLWTTCNGGFSRGKLWNNKANAIHVLCLAMAPLAILPFTTSVATFLLFAGLAVVALNLVIALAAVRRSWGILLQPQLEAGYQLAKAGMPRLPGDVCYYSLLAMPAFMTSRNFGFDRGAEVAYGLVMLTLLMQLVAPANQFVLAETAYLSRSGDIQRLRNRLLKISTYAGTVTVLGVTVLWCFAPQFIWLHLGTAPDAYVESVRWIIPAAIPLNAFIALKGVADAAYQRAVVPHISAAALATFFICYYAFHSMGWHEVAIFAAFHVAIVLLAAATVTFAAKWLRNALLTQSSNGSLESQPRAA